MCLVETYAAVILAGGAGRRLGGPGKPLLPVRGRAMLDRVLDAVADAAQRIVVGPGSLPVPAGVRVVTEEPPGGGPVAALAAGLSLVTAPLTALLAADLPLLTNAAVKTLLQEARQDGALYVDQDGRRQFLCGAWRTEALRNALPAEPAGAALKHVLAGLRVTEVAAAGTGPPPWYDCDEPGDLRRAEEWSAPMSSLDDWVDQVREALNLDPIDATLVLDVARDVAHGVMRPAAPVSAYLLGLAVGRGADPAEAAATVTRLAERWESG
jgi:molybdopterin-guanine dinucleotide biosynthesis protein A